LETEIFCHQYLKINTDMHRHAAYHNKH